MKRDATKRSQRRRYAGPARRLLSGRTSRFLVVEDDDDIVIEISQYLKRIFDRPEIKAASSRLSAMRYLSDGYMFDIVLIDLKIPKQRGGKPSTSNGLYIIENTAYLNPETKYIAMSIVDTITNVTEALLNGAHAFVPKKAVNDRFKAQLRSSIDTVLSRAKHTERRWVQKTAGIIRGVHDDKVLVELQLQNGDSIQHNEERYFDSEMFSHIGFLLPGLPVTLNLLEKGPKKTVWFSLRDKERVLRETSRVGRTKVELLKG